MDTSKRSSEGTPENTTIEQASVSQQRKGFAGMDRETQRAISSKGGKAAHAKGKAHEFTADEARQAGRKGGQSVSNNKEHMARIGREGGKARGQRQRERKLQAAELAPRPGAARGGQRSTTRATASPPPMQRVARPFLALRCFIVWTSVVRMRAPEAPMG